MPHSDEPRALQRKANVTEGIAALDVEKPPSASALRPDGMPVGRPVTREQNSAGGRQIRLKSAENVRKFLADLLRDMRKGVMPDEDLPRARIMVTAASTLAKIIELTDHEERIREIERAQRAARDGKGH